MDDRINIIKNNTPLIDLRAPIEFNKGAFPSSINIPILNDMQRSEVGSTVAASNFARQRAQERRMQVLSGGLGEIAGRTLTSQGQGLG